MRIEDLSQFPDLQTKLDFIKSAASKILKKPKLTHFTDHSIDHSERIIRILDLILGNMENMRERINEHERFILLASVYLHDIGMQSAYHAGLPEKDDYDYDDKMKIREVHHESSYKMILDSVDPNAKGRVNCGLEGCKQPDYVKYIALLSRYHRRNMLPINEIKPEEEYLMTGVRVRVRLLVALLRLADELDRDYMRVNMEELKIWPIPTESKAYWWMHHYTRAVEIENGRIKIHFQVPDRYKNDPSNIDKIIFREVADSVEEQLNEVRNVLWDKGIHLYFERGKPEEEEANYSDDVSLKEMPDEVINYIREKYVRKIEEELSRRGITYYLDGAPLSEDKELKERSYKIINLMKDEKYKEAIDELEDTLRVCILSPVEKMSILLTLGNAYYSLSLFNNALENYNAILKLAEKTKVISIEVPRIRASALGNIGLVYLRKGELDEALKYHEEALKIHREIGDRLGEANQLGNIGLVYYDKGELDEALKYHEEALKIHREIGNRQGEASDLGNIGLVYLRKGELDEALKRFEEALKIDREIGNRQGEANQLGNIGLVYYDKGELDEALKYLEEALDILNRFNLVYGRDIIEEAIRKIKRRKGESQ